MGFYIPVKKAARPKKPQPPVERSKIESTAFSSVLSPESAIALSCLSTAQLDAFMQELVTKLETSVAVNKKWCPHEPHPGPQTEFENDITTREILYGGAAGGGKTDALLRSALRYVHVPGYNAIIFRRTFPQLALADGIIERSREWLTGSGATYNQSTHCWTFPSGATLRFAQLQYDATVHDHHGAAYHFVGFDELTQFTEAQYKYLFSRSRRKALTPEQRTKWEREHPGEMHSSDIPLRFRSTSNPGDIGHVWVKKRFLSEEGIRAGRRFIQAFLRHNPSLDAETYIENLGELDPVSRAQLLDGNWDTLDNCLILHSLVRKAQADCLWPMGQRPSSGRKELYLGVDVGRTKDLTVIWTFERLEGLFICREIKVLFNVKFSEQRREIRQRITRDVIACNIDKGGIGMQLAEELEEEFPNQVQGVQLTAGRQGQLAKLIQADFVEGRVRIPEDPDLQEDIQLIRRVGTKNGVPTILTLKGEVGHGDRFWSMALARYGAPYDAPRKPVKIAGAKAQAGVRNMLQQDTGSRGPIRSSVRSIQSRNKR